MWIHVTRVYNMFIIVYILWYIARQLLTMASPLPWPYVRCVVRCTPVGSYRTTEHLFSFGKRWKHMEKLGKIGNNGEKYENMANRLSQFCHFESFWLILSQRPVMLQISPDVHSKTRNDPPRWWWNGHRHHVWHMNVPGRCPKLCKLGNQFSPYGNNHGINMNEYEWNWMNYLHWNSVRSCEHIWRYVWS